MNENLNKKIRFAISLIQSASKMAEKVGQPLEICYSGGKDSDVILELTKIATYLPNLRPSPTLGMRWSGDTIL